MLYEDSARCSAVSSACLKQLAKLHTMLTFIHDDWKVEQVKAMYRMYTGQPVDGFLPPEAGETLSSAADRTLLQADDQLNLLIRDFLPSPVDFDALTIEEADAHIQRIAVALARMALSYRNGEQFDESELMISSTEALMHLLSLGTGSSNEGLQS